jgi:DNA-binding beta-propeller fold protein YncE
MSMLARLRFNANFHSYAVERCFRPSCLIRFVSSSIRLFGFVLFLSIAACESPAADSIVLVAGGKTDAVGIPATDALLKEPFGTAFDPSNQLWIVEMASGNRLLKIDNHGLLLHIAGSGDNGFQGDGGLAREARFNGPHNLAIRPDGRILIADTWNGRIRQVDPRSGLVESLPGFNVPMDKAKGSGAYCITLDFSGKHLYVADLRRIHRIDLASGESKVVAGNGEKGTPKDGVMALSSPLADPRAVAVDRMDNIYILERGGNALRVVKPDGTIWTVVNASGKKGTARVQPTSNGKASQPSSNAQSPQLAVSEQAIDALMNGPKHLCIDQLDRVVIADAENHLIRRYDPTDGTLRRIAGTGKSGASGLGGDPLQCELARPHGVTVHPQTGELYITDSYNNRVLRITERDQ